MAVHPSQPFVLSCADDMLIKLWDWEKGWKNIMIFEGHNHYVMSVVFNPKDGNSFASASLDKTVKVWNIGAATPNYTLEGHEKGVNWVDYYHGGEKPYMVTAADDKTVKVWDYQNKTCVQTLDGHTQNVCVACFHPELPIIISGSEDGTVKLWHANTYRLENTLNYGFERVWSIAYMRGTNCIGIGYDEGTIAIKLGREEPAASMDNSGKIIWARHNEIQSANINSSDLVALKDGDRIPLTAKDLGQCEVFPQSLQHSPNGRFAVVCGDGEYIIYTALSWRNKSFGSGLEFVWAPDSNEYAVRESGSKVKTFKAFKERHILTIGYTAECIYGGHLIGVKSTNFLCFYDWDSGKLVRRINVQATNVFWSDNGELVCIACADKYFVLKYNAETVASYVESGISSDEGCEEAFELRHNIPEVIKTGYWIGDCFIYCTTSNRLNYLVGGQVNTVSHFDKAMHLLGYLPKESKAFLCDKDMNVYVYTLSLSVLEYQTAILRSDFASAEQTLPKLTPDQRNKVAAFLEGLDMKELAFTVTSDNEHRFDIAIQLGKVSEAYELAKELSSEQKWKGLGDFALNSWNIDLAEECFLKANDLSSLLLIYNCTGNADGCQNLAKLAFDANQMNISFMCYFLTGKAQECADLLLHAGRFAEATIFARTYIPSYMPQVFLKWKEDLRNKGYKKSSEALADPIENTDKFPDLKYSLLAEIVVAGQRGKQVPSTAYPDWKNQAKSLNLIAEAKNRFPDASLLPSVSELIAQARQISSAQTAPQQPKPVIHVNGNTSPARSISSTSSSPVKQGRQSPILSSRPPVMTSNNVASRNVTYAPSAHSEDMDAVSDNMSHMSMEVNTTGTGSVRGDIDMDAGSEMSFASNDTSRPRASHPSANPTDEVDDLIGL